ncbi:serine hydrolase [bacterium]|nr:serine hydrolase [bacterium]
MGCGGVVVASPIESLKTLLEEFVFTHPAQMSVSYTDLTTFEHVGIAENRPYNPASVIKLPVMVAVYHEVNAGRLSLDDTLVLTSDMRVGGAGSLQFLPVGSRFSVRHLVMLMITHSDNTATKMLMERVGLATINRVMQELGLTHTVVRTSQLLRAEGKNVATTYDMNRLLVKLYQGEVISPAMSQDMMGVLLKQQVKWGIPKYLPSTVPVANKTGTLDHIKGDVGIVWVTGHPYALSVFTQKVPNRLFGTGWIAQLSRLVYDWVVLRQAGGLAGV